MNDRERLEAILDVVRDYLPPDGISRREAMNKIIGLVDPLPEQTKFQESSSGQPTTLMGPNLEGILNSAGFFKKREWVSLSHEDFVNEWSKTKGDIGFRLIRFAYDIEAKLKEKNNVR